MSHSYLSKGFTLLEILLVVLIVGIMTVVGTNLINSQSIERIILNQAQKFDSDLQYICEKAVLENQAFGVELLANGYQALRYQQPEWLLVEPQNLPLINAGVSMNLLLDGLSLELAQEPTLNDESLPHIICQSDGSFNAFELRFSAVQDNQNTEVETYYALSSQSPWQLDGAWHQP